MSKVKKPDRAFVYISPIKDCEDEIALQLARITERTMLENISLQIDYAECRVKQVYEYAHKLNKRKE